MPRVSLNITPSETAHAKTRKWRKASVYVLKAIQMLIAIITIVVIRLHSYYYIYSLGVILAITNLITNISVIAMAIAEDFSRYLDIANMWVLLMLYISTCILWFLEYFYLNDQRTFVLVLAGLDLTIILMFLVDFGVHYVQIDKGEEEIFKQVHPVGHEQIEHLKDTN